MKEEAEKTLPGERVASCFRLIVRGLVWILQDPKTQATHYGGLMVCGSVWACPICAAKISERRRIELVEGLKNWGEVSGRAFMLTLTAPHHQGERLKDLKARFTKARRSFRNGKAWKRWSLEVGLVGSVCAKEITWGENGWHLHTHEILFLRPGGVDGSLKGSLSSPLSGRDELLKAWQRTCVGSGLMEPNEHGLTLGGADHAAAYASKWGMEHELTKAHLKRGKHGGLTPWDFLRELSEGGDERFRGLFEEYYRAMKCSRQLVWSDGLRELLGMEAEASDQELAEEELEQAEVLLTITREDWHRILAAKWRGVILEAARRGGREAAQHALQLLGGSRP